MTDPQHMFPPPGRPAQQTPTVRHWDGNGWTRPTPTAAPAATAAARPAAAPNRARAAG
jgi:hypothetical protein